MNHDYTPQLEDILDSSRYLLSDIKPSEWNEKHRVMGSAVSPYPGKFSYSRTPYLREIVNCIQHSHPARIIAVEKGAQIGFSTGVIEAGMGYIISEQPGPTLFLSGHQDLSEEAMRGKIDDMIDSTGLRPLIRASALRKKNQRTGDTNQSKEFPGGSITAGSANNHKLLKQRSVRYLFIDDFDGAKRSSKESGDTTTLIEQRSAAYMGSMKCFYISTPELMQTSNIHPVFLLGDQRRYMVPCPKCGEAIALEWEIALDNKEKAGIFYKTDSANKLIEDSVGYICQKCGEFFDDRDKYEMNLSGFWEATAEPSEEGYYSYHLSSLYAPAGMYDWKYYVRTWLKANPPGEQQIEAKQKTFVNLCLGLPFEQTGEAIKANQLQKNIRNYEIGIVPEKLSLRDGNGIIILLTCACDLNGTEDDARLDYEVLAWASSGATYSICHGSIGTFVPRENVMKIKPDRKHWTYNHNRPNSVWKSLDEILAMKFPVDTGRAPEKIRLTGVDTGHYTTQAYAYIEKTNFAVAGLKGKDVDKFIPYAADRKTFKHSIEWPDKLFLVEVNMLKDDLAALVALRYDENNDEAQPQGFMNFPTPGQGLYLYKNYFSHYEAEHRVIESKEGTAMAARWVKRNTNVQNHFFDVRIYNMVVRDILVAGLGKAAKQKNFEWADFVSLFVKPK